MSLDSTKRKKKLEFNLPTYFTTGQWMSKNVFKGLCPHVFFITVERFFFFVIDYYTSYTKKIIIINRFTCGCAGAVVRSRLTPPPNSLECALLSAVCAASLYSKCASLAASAHPRRAKYTAQKASARRTGSRGESSSSDARSARPRSADTPTTIFIVLIHVIQLKFEFYKKYFKFRF